MVKRAYKGYLICVDTIRETVRIEKDGFHISYAKDETDAKRIIDMLTEK
jgi:L-lactate utilization protein LutB